MAGPYRDGFHAKAGQRTKIKVISQDGELVAGILSKGTVGSSAGGIIHVTVNEHGPDAAKQFFNGTQQIVNNWLLHGGWRGFWRSRKFHFAAKTCGDRDDWLGVLSHYTNQPITNMNMHGNVRVASSNTPADAAAATHIRLKSTPYLPSPSQTASVAASDVGSSSNFPSPADMDDPHIRHARSSSRYRTWSRRGGARWSQADNGNAALDDDAVSVCSASTTFDDSVPVRCGAGGCAWDGADMGRWRVLITELINKAESEGLDAHPGMTIKETFESMAAAALTKLREGAGKSGLKGLGKHNGAREMVIAGSQGSDVNIDQMAACVGQLLVEGTCSSYEEVQEYLSTLYSAASPSTSTPITTPPSPESTTDTVNTDDILSPLVPSIDLDPSLHTIPDAPGSPIITTITPEEAKEMALNAEDCEEMTLHVTNIKDERVEEIDRVPSSTHTRRDSGADVTDNHVARLAGLLDALLGFISEMEEGDEEVTKTEEYDDAAKESAVVVEAVESFERDCEREEGEGVLGEEGAMTLAGRAEEMEADGGTLVEHLYVVPTEDHESPVFEVEYTPLNFPTNIPLPPTTLPAPVVRAREGELKEKKKSKFWGRIKRGVKTFFKKLKPKSGIVEPGPVSAGGPAALC
ncbi:DNA-directed RNA polymerase II subunit rpb1 [Rhizophlyctis rosea]|nr:DNA-directed RNA polymerase II subunit rpb1 [Rhizophlyctis rosea]